MRKVPVRDCDAVAMEPLDPPPRNRVVARAWVVSWLRVSSLAFPTALVSGCVSDAATRYSGGAAPVFHRFPWSHARVEL